MKKLIISPSYNEKDNIELLIRKVFEFADQETDLLIVDDSSPDGTAIIVENLQKEFPRLLLKKRAGKMGLASAYLDVIRESVDFYSAILTMDADISHPPEKIPEMFNAVLSNDFAVGSRYVKGGSVKNWPLRRSFLSKWGNRYVRLILQTGIADSSAGFMCMNTEFLKRVNLHAVESNGYAFLSELKYILKVVGAKHVEVPICFTDRVFGDSKISNNIIVEGLLMPWALKWRSKKQFRKTYNCPNCKNEMLFSFVKKDFDIYKCTKCHVMAVRPEVENKVLQDYYSQEYFKASGNTEKLSYDDYENSTGFKESLYKEVCGRIRGNGKVLDVGCAYGDFVDYLNKSGSQAVGIDMSESAIENGKRKGREVYCEEIEEFAKKRENEFDTVTMLDLLEHVANPEKTLRAAYNTLTSGGRLIVITPTTKSFAHKVLRSHWYAIDPPQHLTFFNEDNIKKIMSEVGFEVVESRKISKVFSVSYFTHILSVWSGIKIIRKLVPSGLKNMKIYYPIKDNMCVVAIKK